MTVFAVDDHLLRFSFDPRQIDPKRGSAPDLAGKGIANPTAMMLATKR